MWRGDGGDGRWWRVAVVVGQRAGVGGGGFGDWCVVGVGGIVWWRVAVGVDDV
jgi:hypothetical protein